MPTNDNDVPTQASPPASDGHGQAALVLVESLIHGLCENATLSADEAVAITERAVSVQRDHAEAADGAGASLWRSHGLLVAIALSLRIETGGSPSPPRLVP